jgi:hypothetical protein
MKQPLSNKIRISSSSLLAVMSALILFSNAVCRAAASPGRLTPVAYESCDREATRKAPEALWDGKATIDSKWCCAHDGFSKEQVHWVAVDLGKVCELSKIIVYHEGHGGGRDNVRFNTEDFALYASRESIRGPWRQIGRFVDNTASSNSFAANGEKARYVKLEITDPMCMNKPNAPNDDWASRILEWEILGSPLASDGPEHQPGAAASGTGPVPAATAAAATAAAAADSSAVAGRPTAYFFFRNDHAESRSYYNEMFFKPEHLPYVGRCTVVPVEMAADIRKTQELGVIRSPTIVLVDPDGRKKASLVGVQAPQTFVKFFADNVK